jgi:hypothetical protein
VFAGSRIKALTSCRRCNFARRRNLGSARGSLFFEFVPVEVENQQGKFAMARIPSPARETRALPNPAAHIGIFLAASNSRAYNESA